MVEIRTERLLLRPARAADLHAIHAIMSDARAMAFWSSPPHAGLDQTRAWLESMIAIPAGEGEDFVVERDGRVIGKMGLYRFPTVGFIFHPEAWSRGFASEALGAVIARAFRTHGLARIIADVDPRNVASLRLLARHGFVESGRAARTWLIGDEWCDSVYLALARHDFTAMQG